MTAETAVPDSTVRCTVCKREERVSFARCLRSGWPKCCRGYTMTLVTTTADVGAATTAALVAGPEHVR